VTEPGKILPKEVIDHWPEVFGEVKLNVLPLRYLHAVLISFKDGKTWEIKVTSKTKREGWDSFEKSLSELFKVYEHKIENINFKLDTERVKKDIEKSTQQFLKKRKL
jgi:hypothetical protein